MTTAHQAPGRALALALCLAGVGVVGLGGCRQDMHDQPKYEAYEASAFFEDGASARQFPEGTVSRGGLWEETPYTTGYDTGGALLETIPAEVTAATLARGRDTYNAFCSACHDRVGTGRGMIVLRGYTQPPSLHEERLRAESDGYYFDVITNGFGQMPSYAAQIQVADRWATVAYVRALQLSQRAPVGELGADDRAAVAAAEAIPQGATEPAGAHSAGAADHHDAAGAAAGQEAGHR